MGKRWERIGRYDDDDDGNDDDDDDDVYDACMCIYLYILSAVGYMFVMLRAMIEAGIK